MAPPLRAYFAFLAVVQLATVVQNVINWRYPYGKRLRWSGRALTSAAIAVGAGLAARTHTFVVAAPGGAPARELPAVVHALNVAAFYAFAGITLAASAVAAFFVSRLMRRRASPPGATTRGALHLR